MLFVKKGIDKTIRGQFLDDRGKIKKSLLISGTKSHLVA